MPGGASRFRDGADTNTSADWVRNDFDLAGIPGYPGTISLGEAYNTPGAPNAIYVPPPEACGDPFTPICEIQGSGPASLLVDGDTPEDIVIVHDCTFRLRAERSGTGQGRTYTITYQVTDACGNTTLASATMTVPRDKRK